MNERNAPEHGQATNCLDRSVYGPMNAREGWACFRCGGYHDANGQPLNGPCKNLLCPYVAGPDGTHAGPCGCIHCHNEMPHPWDTECPAVAA